MTLPRISLLVVLVLAVAAAAVLHLHYDVFQPEAEAPPEAINTGRPPDIRPDYSGCTIPPNIAPLNFHVAEAGAEYRVKVYCGEEDGFVVASKSASIVIPPDKWRALLEENKGGELRFDVYVRNESLQWRRFQPIVNTVAREEIDPYIAFRRIGPVHVRYNHQDIMQQDLTNYELTPILQSPRGSDRCVNCHTFVNNDPQKMVLHMRGPNGVAMLLAEDDKVKKINTRTKYNPSPASYITWHPSGRFASFSAHSLVQLFHSTGFARDVFDYKSDIGFYFVEDNRVFIPSKVAEDDWLEIFPTWSRDGRWLYFCRTKMTWPADARSNSSGVPPEGYLDVRYDLMRVSYDIETGDMGEVETVLSAADAGKSILEPRVSPDGRFVLVTMCRAGNFPVYRESSDLYMVDVESRQYWPLEEANSDRADTWHCWSTNGRWIVFASKRRDNLFGKPYFSYIDQDGKARKAFILPQRDPTFYDSQLDNYNAPEFITGPVTVPEDAWNTAIAASKSGIPVKADSDKSGPSVTPPAPDDTTAGDDPWQYD